MKVVTAVTDKTFDKIVQIEIQLVPSRHLSANMSRNKNVSTKALYFFFEFESKAYSILFLWCHYFHNLFCVSPPLHHFLSSSHYPSCFCCGCEYIWNEIRHHRQSNDAKIFQFKSRSLRLQSHDSNRIPCATTSYSIFVGLTSLF